MARRRLILLLPVFVPLCLAGRGVAQARNPLDVGERLLEQRRHAEARQVLEPLARSSPKEAHPAFLLGRSYRGEENLDQAIHWLEKAVELDGSRSAYHLELAYAYGERAMKASKLKQPFLATRARGAFERAVATDPDNVDAHFGLVQFHVLAPGLMGGDKRKARAHAAEVKKRNPYRGALAMGLVYTADKDTPALITEFEGAVEQFPDSANLYYALGSALERSTQYDPAFELFESLLKRKPDAMGAYYQVGRLGALSGQRLERAEQAMKRYLEHKPEKNEPPLASAHWRLGMVYEKQGKLDLARVEYLAALKLDPRHQEAQASLRRLGSS